MFSCSGHIKGFKLCNSLRVHINLGLSLWRSETGVSNTRVMYARSDWSPDTIISLENQMSFTNGDQLMLTIIYYGWTSERELKYVHKKLCKYRIIIIIIIMMILSYIIYYKSLCTYTVNKEITYFQA